MSVPPVFPLAVATPEVGTLTDINTTPVLADVPAAAGSVGIAIGSAASIVDISNLGEVLSAADNLQSASPAFSDVASAARSLVEALNGDQSNAILSDQSPLTVAAAFKSTSNVNLSTLGLTVEDNAASGNAQFTLNLQSLQTSFQANPAQTAALLAQTIQALGAAATKATGQIQEAPASPASNTEATAANADAQLQLQQSLNNLALEQAISANFSTNATMPTTPATPAQPADSTANNITNAPVPPNAPPAPMDNAAELASDPSVAAAIAAYRLGIRTPSRSNGVRTHEDAVTAVAAVPHIEPVALDVHQK